jgi:hypothetical protein
VHFLEVDPWCFRSGYAKELIARRLRKVALTDEQRSRLGQVLIRAVDVGDRREFSEYCKLARAHATPALREQLTARLAADDAGVRRRALVMLASLRRPRLTPGELAVARSIVLAGARERDQPYWTSGRWVSALAERFSDDGWAHRLAQAGCGGGPDAAAALRVLGKLRGVRLAPEQRDQLASLVLEVIDSGGDESWFESLVPLVDSPPFRQALAAREASADRDVARRTFWARNKLAGDGSAGDREAGP